MIFALKRLQDYYYDWRIKRHVARLTKSLSGKTYRDICRLLFYSGFKSQVAEEGLAFVKGKTIVLINEENLTVVVGVIK